MPGLMGLTGHGVRRFPEPRLRYVGSFDADFPGGGTQVTAVVPVSNLQYEPSPFRQIIVALGAEVPIPTAVTIDGVSCHLGKNDSSRFCYLTGAFNARESGDISVVIDTAAATGENGDILVFEVEYCRPFAEWFNANHLSTSGTTSTYSTLVIPDRAVAILAAINTTDTATFTFNGTGFTEAADLDAGDFRIGAAINATPAVGTQRISSTVVSSAGTGRPLAVAAPPLDDRNVRGGPFFPLFVVTAGDPMTLNGATSYLSTVGLGIGKLIVAVMGQSNSDVVGMTWGGQAMTLLGSIEQSTADATEIYLFEYDFNESNFAGGDIVADMEGVPGQPLLFVRHLIYGAQSSVIQTNAATNTGNAFSVDTVRGSAIIAFHIRGTSTQTTTWTGVEEYFDSVINAEAAYSIATRFCCDLETGRTVQPTGSASGTHCSLIATFHP